MSKSGKCGSTLTTLHGLNQRQVIRGKVSKYSTNISINMDCKNGMLKTQGGKICDKNLWGKLPVLFTLPPIPIGVQVFRSDS